MRVSETADALGLSPNITSKHLRELYRAGLVWRTQEGNFARYSLRDANVARAILLVARSLDQGARQADHSSSSSGSTQE